MENNFLLKTFLNVSSRSCKKRKTRKPIFLKISFNKNEEEKKRYNRLYDEKNKKTRKIGTPINRNSI